MTRKVIFVPDDYWTNPPKENPVTINPANAGDLRRAAAFIRHHGHGSRDGMNAILLEALDVGRASEFINGVLVTYDAIVPQLVTPTGQRCMAEMLLAYADTTEEPQLPADDQRAARFLIAHGKGDRDEMNRIIRETEDCAPTILAMLDVYAVVLPTLHTPFGMDIIDRGIRALAAKEIGGEQ